MSDTYVRKTDLDNYLTDFDKASRTMDTQYGIVSYEEWCKLEIKRMKKGKIEYREDPKSKKNKFLCAVKKIPKKEKKNVKTS